MSADYVLTLGREALLTVLMVGAPVLGLGLLAGLLVSLFQATTQINEPTLSFIPKIIMVLIAALAFGPWMFNKMVTFGLDIFARIPEMVR